MFVRYLGHSSFYINTQKGTRIIIDPYSEYIPYEFPPLEADVVVMSHEHRDHNAAYRVKGSPMIVKRTSPHPMEHEFTIQRTKESFTFYGLPTNHDNYNGRRRGPNTVWHCFIEGVHFVHLGDLGHILNPEQLEAIGKADVLFVPVGGKTTLNPAEAGLVINQLNPNLVFPMHYLTQEIFTKGLAENTLEDFLIRMQDVDDQSTMAYDLSQETLPEGPRVIVLKYA
ncbi:MAG: MBL fold metallo-hydrolase [bacterium]|nr:MBL fold metallo-hydrolase [bacterium]